MSDVNDYRERRLKQIAKQPRIWEAFRLKRPKSANRRLVASASIRQRAAGSIGGLTLLPRTERVPTYYSRPDVAPTEERLYRRVAEARKAGDNRLLLVYRPAIWWEELYRESPVKYYNIKYKLSTALLCKVCENRQCGWNPADIATVVDRTRHHEWTCPRCLTELAKLKKDALARTRYRQRARLPSSSLLPTVRATHQSNSGSCSRNAGRIKTVSAAVGYPATDRASSCTSLP